MSRPETPIRSSHPPGTPLAAHEPLPASSRPSSSLDVERDSDVPISTQIYWQLAYQIDSGRLLPGARLAPVRELARDRQGAS